MSDNQLAGLMTGIAKGLGARLREAQLIEEAVKGADGGAMISTSSGSFWFVLPCWEGDSTHRYRVADGKGRRFVCCDIVVDPSTMNLSCRDEQWNEITWSSRVVEIVAFNSDETLYSRAAYKAALQ